jgi:hypothetical protein
MGGGAVRGESRHGKQGHGRREPPALERGAQDGDRDRNAGSARARAGRDKRRDPGRDPRRSARIAMIVPSPGLRVMVALDPVDFRKDAAGLAALVQTSLGEDAFSDMIYVFRARRADRLKLVFPDGTGLCLCAKTLGAGAACGADQGSGLDARSSRRCANAARDSGGGARTARALRRARSRWSSCAPNSRPASHS